MSISFGVGTLSVLTNNLTNNGVASTGTAGTGITVTSGSFVLDGITGVLSGASATITIAGSTGTGHMLYAFISGGSTITGTLAIALAGDPINTSVGIPTAIVPIARFSFGTAASVVSTISQFSGGSATKVIGKVQNVKIDVSIENAQMRGGGDIYPVDTQFFNGKLEGSFDFADETATQLLFFGGSYASGGAASGTWTLGSVSKPEPVSLSFTNVTNGITSTYTVLRAYLSQRTTDYKRTDYEMPSYSFISQANIQNNVMTVQG